MYWHNALGSPTETQWKVASLASDAVGLALGFLPTVHADIAELSNVSFDEMISLFMAEPNEMPKYLPSFRHRRMCTLCRLISVPQLPDSSARQRELLEAVKRARVITQSAEIFHSALNAHRLEFGGDVDYRDVDLKGVFTWAEIVTMWLVVLDRASSIDPANDALVQEAVKADILPTLELWTIGVAKETERELCTIYL